jgi:hypothetical protein
MRASLISMTSVSSGNPGESGRTEQESPAVLGSAAARTPWRPGRRAPPRPHRADAAGEEVVTDCEFHALICFKATLTPSTPNSAASNSPPIHAFMSACSGCSGLPDQSDASLRRRQGAVVRRVRISCREMGAVGGTVARGREAEAGKLASSFQPR